MHRRDGQPAIAPPRSTWRLRLAVACVLLAALLGGCGSSESATTPTAPARVPAGSREAGTAGEHPSSHVESEARVAEAQEKLESEKERVRGEQVAKEAERLTGTSQEPSEPPETATEQRERELGLGL